MYGSASSSVRDVAHRCSSPWARSCRVLGVDRHVLVAEVGEVALGSRRPRPAARSRTRPRRAGPLPSAPARRAGRTRRRAQTATPSIAMSTASGAVPGSACPTAWMIRPQFGSPPYSAVLTSGESATARATRSTASLVAAADDHAPDAPRALAVARDQQRELAQQPRRAPRRSPARRRSRARSARPRRRCACRITVSLVDSWPSTLIRSNERLTQTPSSRSPLRRQRRVGLDEHQQRREVRRDHPGALAPGRSGARCRRQRDVEARALGERVGGADRLGEVDVAVRRAARAPARGDPAS